MFSIARRCSGRQVTATSRMNPKMTDMTTDMYMPTAAHPRGLVRLLGHVRGGVEAVIVYCAISRPVAKTYQNTGLEKFTSVVPKPEAFTVSPKT